MIKKVLLVCCLLLGFVFLSNCAPSTSGEVTTNPPPTPSKTWKMETASPTPKMSPEVTASGEAPKGVFTFPLNGIKSLAFNPGGTLLALGTENGTIFLWDVKQQKDVTRLIEHTALVTSLSFSADGAFLVSGSADKTVLVWEIPAGKVKQRFTGHQDKVTSVVFAKGTLFWSAGLDGKIFLWDAANGETVLTGSAKAGITALAYHPNGYLAITTKDGASSILDAEKLEVKYEFPPEAAPQGENKETRFLILNPRIAFSPDGSLLASPILIISKSNAGPTLLWNVATGKETGRLGVVSATRRANGAIRCLAFKADGARLAVGSLDGQVDIWDLGSNLLLTTYKTNEGRGGMWDVAFSPDGTLLAAVDNSKLWIWDLMQK
jgi:WD40 repeat protein